MAYVKSAEISKEPQRSSQDYFNPSRSQLVNHLQTEVQKVPSHTLGDFLTQSFWGWIYHYLKSRFGRKHPYPDYKLPSTGVYELASEEKQCFAITSDWATDTPDSYGVARQIKQHEPAYTIHMGDTYFVGAPSEIISNFVAHGSPWIRGHLGSFAVLGNHEMYGRGVAFFEHLLPTLGIRDQSGAYTGQQAGFFCLQTPYWRILGLDTGYHSTSLPLLEFIPGLEPDCRFDEIQMAWLEKTVKLGDPSDKRGLLILTHHQVKTAFHKEPEFSQPARQLASLLGSERTVLWLWGHEHKLAFYQKMHLDPRLTIYGRCIGNGGTPIEINSEHFSLDARKSGSSSLVAFDKRFQKAVDNRQLGFNGYVVMNLEQENLTLAYHDNVNVEPLVKEIWTADLDHGTLHGKMETSAAAATSLTFVSGKDLADAVQ